MSVAVRIPEGLRPLTGGLGEVAADGVTVRDLLRDVDARFHGVLAWACDERGELRPYVSVFINRDNVSSRGGPSAPVSSGDVVSIIAAVSGGAKAVRQLYLTFPQELVREPVIFLLGHEFEVITNIKGASVSENVGFVALEIHGEPNELDRATEWLKNKGVKVEPLENED